MNKYLDKSCKTAQRDIPLFAPGAWTRSISGQPQISDHC